MLSEHLAKNTLLHASVGLSKKMMTQSQQKPWWHFSRCFVMCPQTAGGFSWCRSVQIIPCFPPPLLPIFVPECQTPALVPECPQRQYHSAESLTKSQPRAVCQSLIDPLIRILFTQAWREKKKFVWPVFVSECFFFLYCRVMWMRHRVLFWFH